MTPSFSATDCHVCGKPVLYKEGRRRCKGCHRWFHRECGMDSNYHSLYAREALCNPCLMENPRKPIRALAKAMNKGQAFPALEVILWSMVIDQDEATISSKLKIPLDEVYEMSKRLRDQGVWQDGKVVIDCGPDAEGDELHICLVLVALCAGGEIVRVQSGDSGAYGVQDGGGNTK